MELAEKVVVVTGGAAGIGRALAHRFAAEGAAGVVVADLDKAGAEAVAREIGEGALPFACDVVDPDHADALMDVAESAFGPVDLFCANAGVAVGDGLGETDDWDLALRVNLRAHVNAAERLLPSWLERKTGYFLATASAAGLVTQIGSAPYAVTKHAAVAFAEWLSITYGDRGLGVSCLCPMGVNTELLHGSGRAGDVVKAAGRVLEPDEVAEIVVAGLKTETFLILPHPEVLDYYRRKTDDYDRWLAGMRRLQARVAAS